jgi:hypothetical protein
MALHVQPLQVAQCCCSVRLHMLLQVLLVCSSSCNAASAGPWSHPLWADIARRPLD